MTRHIVWQVGLALLGIALVFGVLLQLGSTETSVNVPATGGSYVEGVVGSPTVINPILTPRMAQANPIDQDLSDLVFEGLTTLDEKGQVSPCLATDWQVSEDGRSYEFNLRHGVTWHDGAPFTAADVVFTVQAIQDPAYQGDAALHELWRNVHVEQLDNYTVRMTLQEPFPSFLDYTTIGLLPTHLLSDVPASRLRADEFSTQHPVGTGMFMVESVTPDRVVLKANPHYWGSQPFLGQLEFSFFGDEAALLASYQRGEIQGFHPLRSDKIADLAGLSGAQLYSAQSAGYGLVYLNLSRETCPFFQVKEVRQALLYGLDRQSIVDGALGGQGVVADSPLPPILWANDPSIRQYGYDPQRAIGLLDAAGWADTGGDGVRDKDGVALAFELLTSDDSTMTNVAQQMANQWRAIGVSVTVRAVKADQLPGLVRSREFDAVLAEVALTADPDPYPLWHSTQATGSGQNYGGFSDEAADLAMEQARSTLDPQVQTAAYHRFQEIFAEEVPALLIYYPTYTYVVNSEVKQVQLSPLFRTSDRFRNVADWYLETSQIVVNDGEQLDNSAP